jgi:hypothetical protein
MSERLDQLKGKLSDTETAIRYILAHFPEARSNDKLLMLIYWEMFDKITIPKEFKQAFLHEATHPETITRMRRKIQEEGNYLPRQEILEARRRKQQAMSRILSSKQKTLI